MSCASTFFCSRTAVVGGLLTIGKAELLNGFELSSISGTRFPVGGSSGRWMR